MEIKEIAYLPYEEIPFMHWGVISRYNFSKDKITHVPRKRWDPLTSMEIKLFDEISRSFVSIGKRKGHFSYVSPVRGVRPSPISITEKNKVYDVFKDIILGKDYAIFVSIDDERGENPFSLKPIMLNISDRKAVTIINRFPAMARHIDEEILAEIRETIERDPHTKIAFGINTVTFPIKYYETLSDITIEDLEEVLKSMIVAINYIVEEAEKKGITLIPIYPFFNIGTLAGGSQPRLHSQVYVDLNMDGHGAFMESVLQAFEEQRRSGSCHLCSTQHEGRVVYENSSWILWVTSSPRRNYHLRIASRRHVERITNLSGKEIKYLAEVLILTSKALDTVGVSKDRNILVYTNPHGYKSFFHLFIDIIPFELIGGIEILDSCRVARYEPTEVAKVLREIVGKISLEENS